MSSEDEGNGSDVECVAPSRRRMLVNTLAVVVGGAVGSTALRPATLRGLQRFIVDDGLSADGAHEPQRQSLVQAACNPPGTYNNGGGCNPQAGCGTLSTCHQEVCGGTFSCVGGHNCTNEHICNMDTCAGDFNCGTAGGVHFCKGNHICTTGSFNGCNPGFMPCQGFITEPPDPGLSRARDIRRAIAKKVA